MKRLLSLILAILLAFTFVSCAEPETPKFTVTFEGIEHDSVVVTLGEKFKLPVDLPTKDGHVLVVKMGDTVLEAGKEYEITADTVLKCSFEKYKWIITVDGVQTQVIDGYKYEILKSKEGYLATSVKVDDEVFKEESIVITKDTKIDYEWAKAWTLTVDGKSELVLDGFGYKIDKTRKGYICKSVKVNGVETDLDTVVIDKDTRIEYVWIPAYTITYTGAINETVAVPRGETYTIPENIRESLTREVGDNEAFIITYGEEKRQIFPGNEIEVTGDMEITASIMEGSKWLVIQHLPGDGDACAVVDVDSNKIDLLFDGTLVIPERIDGEPVVVIMPTIFATIPLNSIYLPEGLVEIGPEAFAANTEIRYIAFPPSLKAIDEYAFVQTSLQNVRFNVGLETINEGAFIASLLTSVELPEGLKTIGNICFAANENLEYVSIPSSVTGVGECLFEECPNLHIVNVARKEADCSNWPELWYGEAIPVYEDTEKTSFTVTFKGAGVTVPSVSVEFGKLFTLPELPKKDGYRLAVTDEMGNEYLPGVKYAIIENTELTCSWIKQWKLTVNGESEIVDDGHVYTVPVNTEDLKVADVTVNGKPFSDSSIEIHADTSVEYRLVPFDHFEILLKWTLDGTEHVENKSVRELTSFRLPAIPGYYVGYASDENGARYHLGMDIVVSQDMTLTYCDILKGTEGLVFDVEGNVAGYTGSDKTVVIPNAAADGKKVTRIKKEAFIDNDNIESVYIPDGVVVLETSSFEGCSSLASVVWPNTLESIEGLCFDGTNLEKVELPEGLKSIGYYAFSIWNLKSISLPKSLRSIEFNAFQYTSIEELYIPENVERLQNTMVSDCNNLKTLTVSEDNPYFMSKDNVIYSKDGTAIIVSQFLNDVPDGIITIGPGAFEARDLKSIVIPDSVTSIKKNGFNNMSNLETVTLSKNIREIGDYAFNNDEKITEITLPNGVETIGFWAFRNTGISSIKIPSSVTYIDDGAFENSASSITVDKSKDDCSTWQANWHGATAEKPVTVIYKDCTVTYPETATQN